MSQRQGGGGICTKNGSYCEKEKKVGEVGGRGQGRCERRSESFVKIQKQKNEGGGQVWGGEVGFGGVVQGGCEWRSRAFVKIGGGWGSGQGGGGVGLGGQGGWEQRSEACVKIQKKNGGVGVGGRVGGGGGQGGCEWLVKLL